MDDGDLKGHKRGRCRRGLRGTGRLRATVSRAANCGRGRDEDRGSGPRRCGAARRGERDRYVLVGNPNVGKSVIFGLLTGRYVTVSNYPGTTVEISKGETRLLRNGPCELIDTPGANNLLPMSEDELVARDLLLESPVRGVVQVVDAKNLRRGLLMSFQLAEMGMPFIVALNMSDEAAGRGIRIDHGALGGALGVDVVPTVATQRKGMRRLTKLMPDPKTSHAGVRYRAEVEAALYEIEPLIPENNASSRAIGLMLLAGDKSLERWVRAHLPPETVENIENARREVRETCREPES